MLLRSWISRAGLAERAAWVPAGRGERDPQRFCLSVLQALHQTAVGSAPVRAVTAALALYRGLARGQMSVVGPVSAVGAAVVPVAPGMALGERPGVLAVAGALVARPPSCSRRPAARCAAGGSGLFDGLAFGILFIGLAQAGRDAGIWPVACEQTGTLLVTLVVAVSSREPLKIPVRAAGQTATGPLMPASGRAIRLTLIRWVYVTLSVVEVRP